MLISALSAVFDKREKESFAGLAGSLLIRKPKSA
jgi:hypothetical protein